jgi:hypothetical protein
MPKTVKDRVRAVREATGLTHPQFAALLNETAARLGISRPRYDETKVRNMERAARGISFDDVTLIAFADPQHRGRSWLAWGDSRDPTLNVPIMSDFDSMSSEDIAAQRRGRGRSDS